MSLASVRTKLDNLRHIARSKGKYAAARRTAGFARDIVRRRTRVPPYPIVDWGNDVVIRGKLELVGTGRVIIGDNCIFEHGLIRLAVLTPDATIELGKNVYLNGTFITSSMSVRVGDDSILGACQIGDTDFHGVDADERSNGAVRPVLLASNVWVGAGALILKGVEVGRDVVIGANSVIRRSIPEGEVVIGNPQLEVGHVRGRSLNG